MLRVALCQISTVEWDLAGNLARTLAAIRSAAAGGAELAITPECVLNGYPGDNSPEVRTRFVESAVRLDGPEVTELRAAAAEGGISVVVGLAEQSQGSNAVHNSAVAIGPDGTITAVYRKVHCRPFESVHHTGFFTPGEEFVGFAARQDVHVGLMICFDREIPESVRCLRALGSQFIACPLATNTSPLGGESARAHNELITRARAAENEVFIAVVNHADRFNGGSFIVGPHGEVLVQLGSAAEVALIDVPIEAVAEQYHADPLGWMGWGYRRPDVYARHLS
jgi:predicted amidohydrolase